MLMDVSWRWIDSMHDLIEMGVSGKEAQHKTGLLGDPHKTEKRCG